MLRITDDSAKLAKSLHNPPLADPPFVDGEIDRLLGAENSVVSTSKERLTSAAEDSGKPTLFVGESNAGGVLLSKGPLEMEFDSSIDGRNGTEGRAGK